jgi:hypothetical protein
MNLKRIVFLVLVFFSLNTSGQNNLLGIKGGVNWTNVITNDSYLDDLTQLKRGISAGFSFDRLIKKHFNLEINLLYDQFGFREQGLILIPYANHHTKNIVITWTYDYITVPCKFGVKFGKKLFFMADIGISPALLVSSKLIMPSYDSIGQFLYNEKINKLSNVNRFDLFWLYDLGLGYKLKDKYILYVTFGRREGLISLSTSNYFSSFELRNIGPSISLGFKYALTKKINSKKQIAKS